jgi:hypothetical protein
LTEKYQQDTISRECSLMRRFVLKALSWIMVFIFPVSLLAADASPAAMLYSRGDTVLNGTTVPRSSALFSGDLVQTGPDSVANINATGSTVLVWNESLVEYEGNFLKLEHGGIRISTSKSMSALAGEVRISPANSILTEFEVRDVDGRVQIAARKGDLTISDPTGTTTLAQGQETTRNEKKAGAAPAAAPGAVGAVLDSPIAIGIGAGAIGALTIWVLTRSDDALSPHR